MRSPILLSVSLSIVVSGGLSSKVLDRDYNLQTGVPGTATAGTASIGGRVTAADTGAPIALVQVRLSGPVAATTLTAKDGSYEFPALPAGPYVVMFTKGGFERIQFGQRDPFDDPQRIHLKDGQRLERIDVRLVRGAGIEGRVLDESGEPVVEANVSAMRLRFVKGQQELLQVGRAAITDDKGRYRVYGLPAGQYYVAVTLRGMIPLSENLRAAMAARDTEGYAPTFYPGTGDLAQAQRVTVRQAMDATLIDVVFRPTRLARILGTIVSSSGAVMDGAHVDLERSRTTAAGALQVTVSAGRVEADGRFGIAGVPPGDYVLRVRSIPRSVIDEIAETGSSLPLVQNREGEFATMPVRVDGEDVTGLVVRTLPGGVLRGTVVLDGRPVNTEQRRSLLVMALPAAADAVAGAPTGLPVAADGTFEIGSVFGKFVVRVKGLQAGTVLSRVDSAGRDVTDDGVMIGSGDVSDVTVALHSHGGALIAQPDTRDPRDDRVQWVIVFAEDKLQWRWPATRYVAATRSDPDGTFRIAGLPSGKYFAAVVLNIDEGQWLDPDYLDTLTRGAARVTVQAGTNQTVRVPIVRP